ncbi:cytochrome b/b6 domain-containing protein [Pseudogulbenkiania ferrooxidans]|uniref:Cytochrome B561 n=1 Tax=Pseudogulbenkiania ferrooxidans 2002 TaxID=279714 RepID=B9Z3E2_9NEIS|nr:cytochrome b/b6 domain-containing protein [Pseudogulbenkiania ferrooxidans]EEG08369.1 cytochrome B561 [Pseudogulbenkiania ferrooxidans 2002]
MAPGCNGVTQRVLVWDLPLRLFHWGMAGLFGAMWFTGKQGGDWLHYHQLAGFTLATLLLFRLVWGVFGSETARFGRFVAGPRTVVRYLRGELSEAEQPGHNPLGGWMVLALLCTLSLQVLSGLFAADVDSYLYDGPLAARVAGEVAERITAWHKASFDALLVLVSLHLLAILVYRVVKRKNLVLPMITGYKAIDGQVRSLHFAPAGLALLALGGSAGVFYALLH